MDDLKHLEGKAVRTIEQNNSGLNSFIIVKFTDDSKLTISAFPHGDKGVAQLDIELENIKLEEIKNQKIVSIEEEFDGEMDKIIINFKNGGKMVVAGFNSKEDATAGMETSVYVENRKKLVGESLDENEYKDGRHGDYIMNSPQYEEEEPEPEKFVKETYDEYDELNLDDLDSEEDIEAISVESPDLMTAIENELKIPETDRAFLDFKLKGTGEEVSGVPMAIMNDGNYILFKIGDSIEKIKVDDMIIESQKPIKWVSESIEDYNELNESMSRHCDFYLATDGKWYLELAHNEYGEWDEATTYGPFNSMEKAETYLDNNFSNPGGFGVDDSGEHEVPTQSPDGGKVVRPGSGGGNMMGGYGRRW